MDGFKTENTHAGSVNQAKSVAQAEHSQKHDAKVEREEKRAEKAELSKKGAEELAKKLDTASNNASIQFKIERDEGRTIIEVKDKESGEVIRTIPNEEALKIAQNIDDFIEINNEKGLAIDDTI